MFRLHITRDTRTHATTSFQDSQDIHSTTPEPCLSSLRFPRTFHTLLLQHFSSYAYILVDVAMPIFSTPCFSLIHPMLTPASHSAYEQFFPQLATLIHCKGLYDLDMPIKYTTLEVFITHHDCRSFMLP